MKKIALLGSTGSIGVSTLDIIRRHPDRFQVVALAAGSNVKVLAEQIKEFSPQVVSVKSEKEVVSLKELLGNQSIDILCNSPKDLASHSQVDTVVSAIVGAAGLLPTLAAIESGKTVALANKESLVIAGDLMANASKRAGKPLIPVDSEHSALFQCLQGSLEKDIKRLILTASGGPFLHKDKSEFSSITPEQALKHPNWDMGAKITIDSATMMNKGLELMEAKWLFDQAVEKIDICVHPQSIIHSMVEFQDSSVMAQLGSPDMRVPIAYALSYPERIETGATSLNLFEHKELTFFEPDFEKFRCLYLAVEVAKKGQTYAAALNAANEECVYAFLDKKIAFTQISEFLEAVLESHKAFDLKSIDDVLEVDRWARAAVKGLIDKQN